MYVLDYHRQLALIKEMVQLRKDDEKWEAYYHHPSTNEMWKSFFPQANGEKRGPKVMRIEPVPEKLEERLDVCLKSDNKDDARGLGVELSVDPHKWDHVLGIIEKQYREYERSQLQIFLSEIGIREYEKTFKNLGYEFQDFGFDEKQLKSMLWRIRKVLFKKRIIFW
ncbi:hypothetical protein [Halalkalibaculum sp. DA384]|uniref:hypothetical protein n=1 Tax=Halalkalibaculum sp. DA384 TaxID=3373606 RepID=UPI003754B2C9